MWSAYRKYENKVQNHHQFPPSYKPTFSYLSEQWCCHTSCSSWKMPLCPVIECEGTWRVISQYYNERVLNSRPQLPLNYTLRITSGDIFPEKKMTNLKGMKILMSLDKYHIYLLQLLLNLKRIRKCLLYLVVANIIISFFIVIGTITVIVFL